jgi:hypothetical protein
MAVHGPAPPRSCLRGRVDPAALLPALSESTWVRIEFLTSIGNTFAKTCLQLAHRAEPLPHPNPAAELRKIFDPAQYNQT